MYRLGHGTKKDYSEAMRSYQKVIHVTSSILEADPHRPSSGRNRTSAPCPVLHLLLQSLYIKELNQDNLDDLDDFYMIY